MSIFVNSSTDPDIRQFWVASLSSSCRSVHTVLQILIFGIFELLTPPWFWLLTPPFFLELSSLHKLTLLHKLMRLHSLMRPWFFHPRTWLHKLTSLHKLTIDKRSTPTVCRWYRSWINYIPMMLTANSSRKGTIEKTVEPDRLSMLHILEKLYSYDVDC